jgi:high-affinity iron transporter
VHTAHEAGWVNVGQQAVADLSGVVAPGTAQAALVTGVLGIQPRPTLIEVLAWALYLVPMLLVVLWRRRARRPARSTATPRVPADA